MGTSRCASVEQVRTLFVVAQPFFLHTLPQFDAELLPGALLGCTHGCRVRPRHVSLGHAPAPPRVSRGRPPWWTGTCPQGRRDMPLLTLLCFAVVVPLLPPSLIGSDSHSLHLSLSLSPLPSPPLPPSLSPSPSLSLPHLESPRAMNPII
ncbi:hypothetical protein ANANG_G00294520 [Anguilla anguilla]|uniref:Uncharacterized protein n=1 Tax=Anguilla anguilla TaxID=7936 RepID=A0A9D3LLP6_ANGAN|nr:hypothetical protein ANANG_G00294520 [Anguilla anguilla]